MPNINEAMARLLSKKRINERGDGRSACQYYQDSEKEKNDYGRQQPEFFPLSEKSYQVTNKFHNAFLLGLRMNNLNIVTCLFSEFLRPDLYNLFIRRPLIGVSNIIRLVQMITFSKYGRCVLFPLFQLQRFGTAYPLEYPERGDDKKKNKR
jgi:hypothetical protein